MHIFESFSTPVRYAPRVLVCGGGVAGIAAAIAAAREGADVLLVERGFLLGGLATAGLVTIFLPLCDGCGKQVSFGLAEELLRLSVALSCDGKRGAEPWLHSQNPQDRLPPAPRFEVNFNPQLFALQAEELLLRLGVRILYGTSAVAVSVRDRKIQAVMMEGKSGRFAVAPVCVIDATGDADLAALAGAPVVRFGQGNVLAAWYYTAGKNGYCLRPLGVADIPDEQKASAPPVPYLSSQRFSGLDTEEISAFVSLSHHTVLSDYTEKKKADPTFGEPATLPTIPQLRMTRRIAGAYTLHDSEMHCAFPDSIGMVSDWRKRGPIYEVPFRTLYSPALRNLLVAGRCTSVTDAMWDIMRVIPCCAVTGQAAGCAAAISDDIHTLSSGQLQSTLRRQQVRIHESEL